MAEQIDQLDLGSLRAFDLVHDHAHVGEHRRVSQRGLVQHDARQTEFGLEVHFERKSVIDAFRVDGDDAWRVVHMDELFTVGDAGSTTTTRHIEELPLAPTNRLVVGSAPLAGALPPMMIAAAERTTQISPSRVARMREKSNLAVDAVRHTAFQIGIGLQD